MRSIIACGSSSAASLPAICDNCYASDNDSASPSVGINPAEQAGDPAAAISREPGFLTIREAAGILRVSESTIRNAIGSGQLRAFRFGARGGSIRIIQADLDDYIANAATAPAVSHTPASTGGQFKHLNASKLLAAWRQQGVLGKQRGKTTTSSSF
jgi:excisionase family DNA binding protein